MKNKIKKYQCLKKNRYDNQDFHIEPVQNQDIFNIMQWRNKQIDILRQKKLITEKEQIEYFERIVFPDYEKKYPLQILMSFFYKNHLIGYGGLVHIQWVDKRAELSYLIDRSIIIENYSVEQLCVILVNLLKLVASEELKLHKLSGETYSISDERITVMEKANFKLEGRLIDQVIINNHYYDSLIHGYIFK